jgi:hypothetical protein
MAEIDMRLFAAKAGTNMKFPAGSIVFNEGDTGDCMWCSRASSRW